MAPAAVAAPRGRSRSPGRSRSASRSCSRTGSTSTAPGSRRRWWPGSSAGRVPEPRVLPRPGDAPVHLRQAAHHLLRGAPPAPRRAAEGVPRRDARAAPGRTASGPTCRPTRGGAPLAVRFLGTLRDGQAAAVEALSAQDCGVLAATTAFGKTVVAAALIARRGRNTLVLVHRRQLLDQWVERLRAFLSLEDGDVGVIGGGKRRPSGRIDIALIQSLVRKGEVSDLSPATAISSSTSATTCPRSASSWSPGGRRRATCWGSRRRSRARTATTRSSSCSAARCGTGWTPARRRRAGPSRTAHGCGRPASGSPPGRTTTGPSRCRHLRHARGGRGPQRPDRR